MRFKFQLSHLILLHKLYQAACVALKLNRKKRRKLMKTGDKFKTATGAVNLKPAEVRLTRDLLALNIQSLESLLLEMNAEDEATKIKMETLHEIYSNDYDYLKEGAGENEAA